MTNEESWDKEKERIKGIVDECVSKMGEHVDAVQVIVSYHNTDANNTMSYEKGAGNIHTRIGVVAEWMEAQKQYVRNWAIRKDQEEED